MFFDEKVFLAVVGGGFLRTPYLHAVNELPDNVDEQFDCEISGQVIHIPAALRVSGLTMDNPPFRRVVLTSDLTKRMSTAQAITYNQEQAGITFGFHDQPHHNVARAFIHDDNTQYRGDPALILDVLESAPVIKDSEALDPVYQPALYYKFNEETGATTVTDDNGFSDGTIFGTVSFDEGVRGNAIDLFLSGAGNHAYVQTDESLEMVWNDSWSVSLWMKVDAAPATTQTILEQLDEGLGNNYRWLTLTTDMRLRSHIGGLTTDTPTNAIQPGIWHLVVVIAWAGSVSIYVDGDRVGYQQHNRFLTPNIAPFRIGNGVTATDDAQFIGLIDEFAMYQRVVTLQEIEDLLTMGANIGFRIDDPLVPNRNPQNPNFINRTDNKDQPTGFLFFVSRAWKDERHVEPSLMMDHHVPLQYDQEFDSIPLIDGKYHLTIPVYGAKGAVRAYDLRLGKVLSGRTVGGGFLLTKYDIHGAPYLELYGSGSPNGILELAIEDDSGQFFSRRLLIEGTIPDQSTIILPSQRIGTPVKMYVGMFNEGLSTIDEAGTTLPAGLELEDGYVVGTPTEYGPYFEVAGNPSTECLADTERPDCPSQTALAFFAVNRPPRTLMKINPCHGTTYRNDHSTGEYYAVQFMPYGLSMVYGGWAYRACRRFSSTFRYPKMLKIPYVYGWGNRRSGVGEELIWRTQVP